MSHHVVRTGANERRRPAPGPEGHREALQMMGAGPGVSAEPGRSTWPVDATAVIVHLLHRVAQLEARVAQLEGDR